LKKIDLTNKLEGHIVLWAKNWYGERTIERLAEVQREWSGMPNDWTPHPKHVLQFLRETADALGINGRQVVECIIYKFWIDNNKPSTYHVTLTDKIELQALIQAYADAIVSAPIKTKEYDVVLPQLLHNIQYKYELERP